MTTSFDLFSGMHRLKKKKNLMESNEYQNLDQEDLHIWRQV